MGSYAFIPYVADRSLQSIQSNGLVVYRQVSTDPQNDSAFISANDTRTVVAFYGTHRVIASERVMSGTLSYFSDSVRGSIEVASTGVQHTRYKYGYSNVNLTYDFTILAGIQPYNSLKEVLDAFDELFGIIYPITYRPTNCSFPGAPVEALVGDTVIVPVSFPDGYGLANESNIYVTNNGVAIPSTYSNGQLTFTMPDPS